MKNVMVANMNKSNRYKSDRIIQLLKTQIENSLDLGWKFKDIIIISNFEFEWKGVCTIPIELNKKCLTGSKMFGIKWIIENTSYQGPFWVHDLDLWQNNKFSCPPFKDAGICFYSNSKFNGGCVFWKREAKDIIDEIVNEILKNEDNKEEPTINKIFKSNKYKSRITKLNETYNVGCSGFYERYIRSHKPIKCLHFHPYNRIAWETHVLDRNGIGHIAATPRLEKVIRNNYKDLPSELSDEGKIAQRSKISKRKQFFLTEKDGFVNDLEIRVFAMRRSGSHAIINWIADQSPKKPFFLDCVSNQGQDPYRTGKDGGKLDNPELWDKDCLQIMKRWKDKEIYPIRKKNSKILIYNYEDLDISKLKENEYPLNRESVLGKSKKRIDIVIIREFKNWFASKFFIRKGHADLTHNRFEKNRKQMKWYKFPDGWEKHAKYINGLDFINRNKFVSAWENLAKEYMKETNYLDNTIFIIYDKWHIDENYRKEIIKKLGFNFTDNFKNKYSKVGANKIFLKDEEGFKKDVLNRHKYFENNDIVQSYFNCIPNIIELNINIFKK